MFKKSYFLSFITILALVWFITPSVLSQDQYDVAPYVAQADTTPPVAFPYPTLFNFHYSTIATPALNGGTVGAIYLQNRFYLNRWNSTMLYRYNGTLGGPTTFSDSATYQGYIRDLATDGTFLYGAGTSAGGSATIHKMNALGISQGTITSAGGIARAIAYSPDENALFVCDFSNNIGVINATTGALIRTLTGTSTLAAKYGMAYSNIPPEGPVLWVWGQGTTADPFNNLWKVNPQTGATIVNYRFGPYPVPAGATSHSGIAGGAEICVINGHNVLLLNHQNYALTGYDLGLVVPVELTSFTSSVINGKVNLNWSTATETNNYGFDIERKADGQGFTKVGFVAGFGTTTETKNYSFIDNVTSGNYTYRLKQVDFDGTFEYSNEVEVTFAPTTYSLVQNYPNPFNPTTKIDFALASDSKVTLKIFDILGQEVTTLLNGNLSAGIHTHNFDASGINSGVYFYTLEATGVDGSNFTSTKKMILTK